jgi:hypothetical protein
MLFLLAWLTFNFLITLNLRGLYMRRLPIIGDTIIFHNFNEDCGINEYEILTMINSILDNGADVYILKSSLYDNKYKAVKSTFFEYTHNEMVVLHVENKSIIHNYHDENYAVLSFNVFKNEYMITTSNKSSEKVTNEIKDILNKLVNIDSFKSFLRDGDYSYKVFWKKDHYEWYRI